MNNDVRIINDDDDPRYRSLAAYHQSKKAQAELAIAAVKFVRDRPGTTIAIAAVGWWLLGRWSRGR